MDTGNYKYYEIAEKIQSYIKEMHLHINAKLPSIRVFARKYDVSKNTVIKAFEYLNERQLIELREKTGAYVAWDAWFGSQTDDFWYRFTPYENLSNARQDFMKHINSVSIDKISTGTPYFSEEFNADTYLAYAIKDVYRSMQKETLANRLANVPNVLEAVCMHLLKKGIMAEPDNIILTNGVRHGMSIALLTLLSEKMYLLCENPSVLDGDYYASLTGSSHCPVSMDNEGVDVFKIHQMRYKRRAVMVASAIHQYPTGVSMSKSRKLELLDACKELQIPLIELDFFSDCINGEPLRAIDDNTVIYCGTLKHTFSLGMNVGWMVVPKCMIDQFRNTMTRFTLYQDSITHSILEALLAGGYYYTFLRHSAPLAKDRVELTNRLLCEYLSPYVTWNENASRILYWLNFHGLSVKNIFDGLKNIINVQGQIFGPQYSNCLSFCPMSLTEDELQYFMRTISARIKEVSHL